VHELEKKQGIFKPKGKIMTADEIQRRRHQVPFAFTGKLNKLTVKVSPKQVSAEQKAATEKKVR
jgi:hypothetical protein